jgi:uncharacterized membrane protein YciS (DUF1049 family)
MSDRNGKWSTSTVFMAMFLGFALGFICCHKMYMGLELKGKINELR